MNAIQPLVKEVRLRDYERFLAIQRAPMPVRAALYAVTALNSELAAVAANVSEPMLGHIRFAWWREALEEIIAGAAPRAHPLLLALAPIYVQHPEIFGHLLTMVETRAADLEADYFADEAAWFQYLDGTAGALHACWATLLTDMWGELEALLRAQARAYAVVGLVRAIPYMAAHGEVRFAGPRLAKAEITSLAPGEELQRFVRQLLSEFAAKDSASRLPPTLLPLNLLNEFTQKHVHYIKNAQYNPYITKKPRVSLVFRAMTYRVV